jgi:chromosome segregation ATPase
MTRHRTLARHGIIRLMKRVVLTLLRGFGLAPAGHVASLTAAARDAAHHIKLLEERVAHTREDAESWKRRHEETADAMAGWKHASTSAHAETDRVRADLDRVKAELDRAIADQRREQAKAVEWQKRAEKLAAECDDLRARLEKARTRAGEAERSAETANQHLMAMEVKLDLIEAAIHVLDARSREHAVEHAEVARADA